MPIGLARRNNKNNFEVAIFGDFEAIVGHESAQSVPVPSIDDNHAVFGDFMIDVGHDSAHSDQFPLTVFLDLGHDAYLSIVVDEAIAAGHLVGGSFE